MKSFKFSDGEIVEIKCDPVTVRVFCLLLESLNGKIELSVSLF